MEAETRGVMYRAVGHILGLVPEVETACDGWISSSPLAAMSEFMFRFALPIMPDGLVIEREDDDGFKAYFVVSRQDLIGLAPKQPVTDIKRTPPADVTARAVWWEIRKAGKSLRDWKNHYETYEPAVG